MSPQLCLGTAQYGLPYGTTNATGQVPLAHVRRRRCVFQQTLKRLRGRP
jgi:hypothetical protein